MSTQGKHSLTEGIVILLDILCGFDVFDKAIIKGLEKINCGEKTYSYVKAFLRNKMPEEGLGKARTPSLLQIKIREPPKPQWYHHIDST